jgi:hypothetical protein
MRVVLESHKQGLGWLVLLILCIRSLSYNYLVMFDVAILIDLWFFSFNKN